MHYHLNPWLVLSHFLLSLVVLTLGVALAVEVTRSTSATGGAASGSARCGARSSGSRPPCSSSAARSRPRPARIPGSTVVRRLWSFQPAVYWHVRATAVFGIAFALLLVWLVRNRSAAPARRARSCSGCSLVQMAVGEIQYRTHLPWWLVLVHVTIAATVWAAVDRVRRPPLAAGVPA